MKEKIQFNYKNKKYLKILEIKIKDSHNLIFKIYQFLIKLIKKIIEKYHRIV